MYLCWKANVGVNGCDFVPIFHVDRPRYGFKTYTTHKFIDFDCKWAKFSIQLASRVVKLRRDKLRPMGWGATQGDTRAHKTSPHQHYHLRCNCSHTIKEKMQNKARNITPIKTTIISKPTLNIKWSHSPSFKLSRSHPFNCDYLKVKGSSGPRPISFAIFLWETFTEGFYDCLLCFRVLYLVC